MPLLRPMTGEELAPHWDYSAGGPGSASKVPSWWHSWLGCTGLELLADDIEQLASDVAQSGRDRATPGAGDERLEAPDVGRLLGNHADDDPLSEALEQCARARAARDEWRRRVAQRGAGRDPVRAARQPEAAAIAEWQTRTLAVLQRHLAPAAGAPRTPVSVALDCRCCRRPTGGRSSVPRGRRSCRRPSRRRPRRGRRGRAGVLDVSGSMNAEMPLVVALLGQLSA